jgi:hypothetical protein
MNLRQDFLRGIYIRKCVSLRGDIKKNCATIEQVQSQEVTPNPFNLLEVSALYSKADTILT